MNETTTSLPHLHSPDTRSVTEAALQSEDGLFMGRDGNYYQGVAPQYMIFREKAEYTTYADPRHHLLLNKGNNERAPYSIFDF